MSTRFDVWGRRVEAEIKDKTVFIYTRYTYIIKSEMATQKLPAFLVDRIFELCETRLSYEFLKGRRL